MRLASLISGCALVLVGCGDDGSSDGGSSGSTTQGTNPSTTSGPSTSTGPDAESTSTTGDSADDTGTTTGGTIDPDPIYESISGGAFAPFPGYDAAGRAHLYRTLGDQTVVELHIEGLEANTDYPAHVHRYPCDVDDGGGHYQIEPGGPVDDVNELWPAFTSDAEGVGQASITVDHRVRGDAQAIVVHDPNNDNARLACATLSFDPAELAEHEGTFAPFAAAEAIDQDIAGTARMEVRPSGTTVSVDIEGLDPAETYSSHVHEYPCDVADGGMHYQRTPGGPVEADNELWPAVMPDAMGTATDSLEVTHVARGDAQSVVIHRMTPGGNPRVACAPLPRLEYPDRHTTEGDGVLLPGGTGTFDGLEIGITMERDLAGFTRASLSASGAPAGDYPVHVHHRTCGLGEGGGHYKIDPDVAETVEDNEIWLSFGAGKDGSGAAEIEVEHTARPEALSVVVHDPEDSSIRVSCTDLVDLP